MQKLRDTIEQIERYQWTNWEIPMNKMRDNGEQFEESCEQIEGNRISVGNTGNYIFRMLKGKKNMISLRNMKIWRKEGVPLIPLLIALNGYSWQNMRPLITVVLKGAECHRGRGGMGGRGRRKIERENVWL